MVRYLFAALGTATVLPAVEAIGVGWFSTISAGFLALGAGMVMANVRWGRGLREGIDRKRRAKRREREDKATGMEGDVEREKENVVGETAGVSEENKGDDMA